MRGGALTGHELIQLDLDQQQLARQRTVPERVLLVTADAHALAEIRRGGEYRGFPAQAGLAQAFAEVLVEIEKARLVAEALTIGRIADHQALLILVRARLEVADITLIDLDPAGQPSAFDVVASRLDQPRIGLIAANP